MATGLRERAWVIALSREANDWAPNVFGRLWSCPLSSVMSAKFPAKPKALKSTSRTSACVTTSSGAPAGRDMEDVVIISYLPLLKR